MVCELHILQRRRKWDRRTEVWFGSECSEHKRLGSRYDRHRGVDITWRFIQDDSKICRRQRCHGNSMDRWLYFCRLRRLGRSGLEYAVRSTYRVVLLATSNRRQWRRVDSRLWEYDDNRWSIIFREIFLEVWYAWRNPWRICGNKEICVEQRTWG